MKELLSSFLQKVGSGDHGGAIHVSFLSTFKSKIKARFQKQENSRGQNEAVEAITFKEPDDVMMRIVNYNLNSHIAAEFRETDNDNHIMMYLEELNRSYRYELYRSMAFENPLIMDCFEVKRLLDDMILGLKLGSDFQEIKLLYNPSRLEFYVMWHEESTIPTFSMSANGNLTISSAGYIKHLCVNLKEMTMIFKEQTGKYSSMPVYSIKEVERALNYWVASLN